MPACRRSVSAPIRSNLVIALGDLSVRFPNTLEPWTAKMYGMLEDPHEGAPGTPFVLIWGPHQRVYSSFTGTVLHTQASGCG